MKKGKRIICLPLLITALLITQALSAQVKENNKKKRNIKTYSNSIKISGGYFYLKDRKHDGLFSFSPIEQIGASVEKNVYKNWHLGAGFYKWQAWHDGAYGDFSVGEPLFDSAIGSLYYRQGYKMLDFYFFYKSKLCRQHFLSIGSGGSYCWGVNSVIKEYYQIPGYNDAIFFTEDKHVRYWGAFVQAGYEYVFFKNRLCAGLDYRIRWYHQRYPAQRDIAIHFGFNF